MMDRLFGSQPVLVTPKDTGAVYSLYDDVLLSIFLALHHTYLACRDGDVHNSLSTTKASPWVLSHVCQHWRTLVVSAPLLWTTITLNMDHYVSNVSGPPQALEIVLQRSGGLELDVHIHDMQRWSEQDINERRLDEVRACVHSLVRLLLPTTARWRHLEIASSRDMFKGFAGCSFERLESVDIDFYWDGGEDDAVITLFRDAPKLVELKLENRSELDIDLPWAGIQTFSPGSSGLPFLPRMLGLQVLQIKDSYDDMETLDHWNIMSEWEHNIAFFELPLLHTIMVREGDTNPIIYNVSRRLGIPSLTTLVLNMWNHAQGDPPAPRLRFPVFDNLHSLVNLSLDFFPFEVTNIPFLIRTSSVANLYLGQNAATLTVMEAIALGVVPMLQTLGLHFSTWRKSPDAIISMLFLRAMNDAARPITVLRFARFGVGDELNSFTGDAQRDGWDEWLSGDALQAPEGLEARWAEVRKNTDVQIVERYSFDA